ncbi:MAG: two-component regulator propeller domain-containing protein, partial [Rhodothermales bacterium]|nr:two-component regulator propeller domain-containing protein [Rhodothermales bacterium]
MTVALHLKRVGFLASLMVLVSLPVSAQLLPFTHYTPDNEIAPLPSADVIDVDQDRLGFIWLTVFSSGLVRYDGHTAEVYAMADGLRDLSVRTVTEDRLGRLWVASDGGLSVSTKPLADYGPNERIRFSTRIQGTELLDVSVTQVALSIDRDGRIWAGTSARGIVRYTILDDGSLAADTISTAVDENEENLIVYAVETRRNGDVWATVSRFNTTYFLVFEEGADDFDIVPAPFADPVNVLYDAPDSTLWVGTKVGSVWRLAREATQIRFDPVIGGLEGDI